MSLSMLLLSLLLLQLTLASTAATIAPDTTIDACKSVLEISAFAAAHCDGAALNTTENTQHSYDEQCTEAFRAFARDNSTFNACEAHASPVNAALLQHFKTLYSAWQQTRVCAQFHAREKQAARECSGDNVHRPWNDATWPLFCHETFTSYRENRSDLDAFCERTADSPAFWEAYADYIASPTCKIYYDHVRAAVKHDCGAQIDAPACVRMFVWYSKQQREIETDCLELHNTRPFYRGFYKWKKEQ